jgi:hypothetical protein
VAWKLFSALIIVAVLGATGCGEPGTTKTDEDPAIAEYVVTVDPGSAEIGFGKNQTLVAISTALRGECVGPVIPDNCATYKPRWGYYSPSPYITRLDIANLESPDTTAVMFFDAQKFLKGVDAHSLTGNRYASYVSFYPRSAFVQGKLALRGPARFDFNLRDSSQPEVADQQEKKPDEPRLSVAKGTMDIYITGEITLPTSKSDQTRIIYHGPETTISELKITGLDAANFSVVSPAVGHRFPSPETTPFWKSVFKRVTLFPTKRFLRSTPKTANGPPTLSSGASVLVSSEVAFRPGFHQLQRLRNHGRARDGRRLPMEPFSIPNDGHSYLSATIGSTFVARRAGM